MCSKKGLISFCGVTRRCTHYDQNWLLKHVYLLIYYRRNCIQLQLAFNKNWNFTSNLKIMGGSETPNTRLDSLDVTLHRFMIIIFIILLGRKWQHCIVK